VSPSVNPGDLQSEKELVGIPVTCSDDPVATVVGAERHHSSPRSNVRDTFWAKPTGNRSRAAGSKPTRFEQEELAIDPSEHTNGAERSEHYRKNGNHDRRLSNL
jgi:Ni/Co efflux regulator RcnB